VPCTAEEVAALDALVAPHHLPAAYVEFLRYGGKELAGVFHGLNFTYFDLTEGDDPPTYFWEEGDGGLESAVRDHDAFSSFVLTQAKLRIEFLRRNPRR
jgi:hypothetical protein